MQRVKGQDLKNGRRSDLSDPDYLVKGENYNLLRSK